MPTRAGLILANRAFLDHDAPPGEPAVDSSGGQGGLLAAVRPQIEPWHDGQGSVWIGAGRGPFDREFTDAAGWETIETPRGPVRHRRLYFDGETWRGHYAAVANSFLWPLLHLVRLPLPVIRNYYPAPHEPDAAEWEAYREVNRAFATAALELQGERTCWVHDYQLALVPAMLRTRGYRGPIGFFLHTPFPDLQVAAGFLDEHGHERLRATVEGMLGAHLLGFQSEPDVERFCAAASELCGARREGAFLRHSSGRSRVAALPVGVDFDDVRAAGEAGVLPDDVRTVAGSGLPLVVGLERADFTKGIPERLDAVRHLFDQSRPFAYIGVAAPTREGVAAYTRLRKAIDDGAARAAQAAVQSGGRFLQLREILPWSAVIALQRTADVVFTSSLADGMNLVPLQAIAAQSDLDYDERGIVITGRDAGVAATLSSFGREGLIAVDPLDPKAMVDTLSQAVQGRFRPVSDRLVEAVRSNDAHAWGTRFLSMLEDAQC